MNIIVDTGCANLASVSFAIERLGFNATISSNAQEIQHAEKVILPGVGTAKHAMNNLIEKDLVTTIQQLTQPVLGFCLGMQLMASESEEAVSTNNTPQKNNTVKCLNVIPTKVSALNANGKRLPHMGWNTLTNVASHPLLEGIKAQDYFYFVHSFAAPINDFTIASCRYGGDFSAVIANKNFMGCQFHPERSGPLGSQIIKNFLVNV
ncbi:imidazole glycerol phosphate synthase subunit HisH [Flocculibacter collagenilyticus]|uniref:imidazole glycerol phosphate synthase subunit HisH n=1 Tax=Flocculibacter collagenilyticus TaxID=2744479 RepID=UPI0018F42AD0|nr:imidazole glycerol phosphate synthase subunit HisH [Flocculibacter collagenilyticus]